MASTSLLPDLVSLMRKVLLLKEAVLGTENEIIEHAGVRPGLVDMTELSLTLDGATRGE